MKSNEQANGQPRAVPDDRSRGSALVMAIFVLVLLAGVGVALLFLAQTEVDMSRSDSRSKAAFFLAEAGLESGRANLANTNALQGGVDLDAKLLVAAGTDGEINFDVEALVPVYDSDGNLTELTGYGDDEPLLGLTVFGDGQYAAFLTNDTVEGLTVLDDDNNRVIVTGVGAGPDMSLEIVQAIVEPEYVVPTVPALITLLGPTPDFYGGVSDCDDGLIEDNDSGDDDDDDDATAIAMAYDGDDDDDDDATTCLCHLPAGDPTTGHTMCVQGDLVQTHLDHGDTEGACFVSDPADLVTKAFIGTDCQVTGLWVPVVATISNAAESKAEEGIDPVDTELDINGDLEVIAWGDDDDDDDLDGSPPCYQINDYVSGIYTLQDSFANATDVGEETVISGHGTLDPRWLDCNAVVEVMTQVEQAAGFTCSTMPCVLPATTRHSVVFIDGDLHLDGSTHGKGLLAVTGTLTMDGDANWDGLILVIGKGEFYRTGGGGGGHIVGATVVANIAGLDGFWDTADDCTAGPNGFDSATYHEEDEMYGNTRYCLERVEDASPLRTWDVHGFRQH